MGYNWAVPTVVPLFLTCVLTPTLKHPHALPKVFPALPVTVLDVLNCSFPEFVNMELRRHTSQVNKIYHDADLSCKVMQRLGVLKL